MSYTRMFTASCDKCLVDYDEGFWYKVDLQARLKEDGWIATDRVICPDCQAH